MAWGFYSWGSLDLLVAKGSYIPPSVYIGLTEFKLIPSGDNLNPTTIIQQGGRGRKRVSFQGYADKTDYDILHADYIAVTEKTFTDIENVTFNGIIESFNSGYDASAGYYVYSISLLEV